MSGTPAYMSPEQLEGHELTVKSDIYSLGLVLYEVFTGKKAFEAVELAGVASSATQRHNANQSRAACSGIGSAG